MTQESPLARLRPVVECFRELSLVDEAGLYEQGAEGLPRHVVRLGVGVICRGKHAHVSEEVVGRNRPRLERRVVWSA